MHLDHYKYHHYTSPARLEKSINSLVGIVEGITIDQAVNTREVQFLNDWLAEHSEVANRHPYNELIPVLNTALADGVLTADERDDILWLCNKLQSSEFFDAITTDLQRLHAILGAILADGVITEAELTGLSAWLAEHNHLQRCWPYDEIHSLVVSVMADKRIDEQEQKMLRSFFSEFIAVLDDRTITAPPVMIDGDIVGLCAVCPDIALPGSVFCFTGASSRYTRNQLADVVRQAGGEFVDTVSKKVHYLIIGADGNPCWAYACYGRKVEKAVKMRKEGSRILIVHEHDFHDAVADA